MVRDDNEGISSLRAAHTTHIATLKGSTNFRVGYGGTHDKWWPKTHRNTSKSF